LKLKYKEKEPCNLEFEVLYRTPEILWKGHNHSISGSFALITLGKECNNEIKFMNKNAEEYQRLIFKV